MKCLTICSSRNRPDLCKRMLDSFYSTKSPDTDIFVYVDENDPQVERYHDLLRDTCDHEIGPHRFMCHVLNYGALVHKPGLDYYHEVNDDHIFRTMRWDTKLMGALKDAGDIGIAYGVTENLPTSVMISGLTVRTLGYFVPGVFTHNGCDLYIDDLCLNGFGVHVPKVLIEHMHAVFSKGERDENYEWVTSAEQMAAGINAYNEWKSKYRERDISRLHALRGDVDHEARG